MIVGELAKLKIIAFKDASFNDSKRVGERFFLAQVNPETYSINYSASYRVNEQAPGLAGYDPPWERNEPKSMRFEFLFDGTGAIPNFESKVSEQLPNVPVVENLVDEVTSRVSVLSQIAFFENTVFNVQGDTHVPNYLVINWGSLVFKCRLKEMGITYKLFSPEGFPLRATANATFIEVHSEADAIKKVSPGSPDITHVLQVQEGDTLPLMAKRVYGDERYYIAVAQANRLVQFRNLTPGQEIYFPPIRRG
jgi:hypothetical protein